MRLRREDTGVWMISDTGSAARHIAIRTMAALGLNINDWRTRDKIIAAIADDLDGMLDTATDGGDECSTISPS